MFGEKYPIVLNGGPMDGYDGIDTCQWRKELIPLPHHRRECGCERLIPKYVRTVEGERNFHFVGMADGQSEVANV